MGDENETVEDGLRRLRNNLMAAQPHDLEMVYDTLLELIAILEYERKQSARGMMSDYVGNGNPTILG